MTSEQTNVNEYRAQAVAKAARMAIQTMSAASTGENVGPRMCGPMMKQPTFDWSAKEKYAELRNTKLGVKNMFQNF